MTTQQKIAKLKKQIQILQLKLRIALLKQKLTIPDLDAPTKIIVHHGGGWLDFAGVDAYHKYKWGFRSSLGYYAGYTYFIERDGKTIQARADNEKGAHTKGYNLRTIGVCLMGNGVEKEFTDAQLKSLNDLIYRKRAEYKIPKTEIYGHRDFSATICPSDKLYARIEAYKKVI